MKPKTVITGLLLAFVGVSVAFAIYREATRQVPAEPLAEAPEQSTAPAENAAPEAVSARQVIVYYFYTNKRCASCEKIERTTKMAIDSGFADAMKDGTLLWRPLNTDEPEHARFLTDYDLYTKSVVVVDMREGEQVRWRNLDEVWFLLDDEGAFIQYIQTAVGDYLSGEAA
jgi:hypothetical protein